MTGDRKTGGRARRFSVPRRPEGNAEARTEELWRALLRHIEECERELDRLEERAKRAERQSKEEMR